MTPAPPASSPPQPRRARPFAWSVRRELWENRSVTWAPPAVAALVLVGSAIAVAALPRRLAALATSDPAALGALIVRPFEIAPAPIMLASFLVGAFYALDALYGERRDRSVLFWKSLPVSDRTTVLAKAAVPLVVLPLLALALSVATFFALLLFGSVAFAAQGASPGLLWSAVPFVREPLTMLYGLAVHALWFAPLYGWLLLVSAWARRMPLLWAALPPLAVGLVEHLATGTSRLGALLRYRAIGAMDVAFDLDAAGSPTELTPLDFLATPGLWLGLLAAAAFLAAAVRLRRRREPV
jgi:ABC-2 type transport system permease protein